MTTPNLLKHGYFSGKSVWSLTSKTASTVSLFRLDAKIEAILSR